MRRQLPRVLTTRTSVDRERPKAERKQLLAEAGEQIKALDNVELPKLDAAMVTRRCSPVLPASRQNRFRDLRHD